MTNLARTQKRKNVQIPAQIALYRDLKLYT